MTVSGNSGSALPLLPKGYWAIYRGALYKTSGSSRVVLPLFSEDPQTEQLGFRRVDDDDAWILQVDRDSLDRLFRVLTVCEWRGALWSVMSLRLHGAVFLSWVQGSAQFEELREKTGVQEFDRGLVGEPQLSEVENVRSWVEYFDVQTGERNGGEIIPDIAELCKEFKMRNSG